MNIPRALAIGDSITWKDTPSFDNLRNPLSPPTWTLKYALRGATVLDLTATQDGANWSTSISTAQSGGLTAGTYYWTAWVESGSQKITLGSGKIEITVNMSGVSANTDLRSQVQKDLEAVQSAMRSMIAGGAVQKYAIAGRQVEKMSISDLRALESRLKYQLKREEAGKSGKANPFNSFVRFTK